MDVLYVPTPEKRGPRPPWGLRAWRLPVGSVVLKDGVRWQKVYTYDFWEPQVRWSLVDDIDTKEN